MVIADDSEYGTCGDFDERNTDLNYRLKASKNKLLDTNMDLQETKEYLKITKEDVEVAKGFYLDMDKCAQEDQTYFDDNKYKLQEALDLARFKFCRGIREYMLEISDDLTEGHKKGQPWGLTAEEREKMPLTENETRSLEEWGEWEEWDEERVKIFHPKESEKLDYFYKRFKIILADFEDRITAHPKIIYIKRFRDLTKHNGKLCAAVLHAAVKYTKKDNAKAQAAAAKAKLKLAEVRVERFEIKVWELRTATKRKVWPSILFVCSIILIILFYIWLTLYCIDVEPGLPPENQWNADNGQEG